MEKYTVSTLQELQRQKQSWSVRNELRQFSARCSENSLKGYKKAALIKIKSHFQKGLVKWLQLLCTGEACENKSVSKFYLKRGLSRNSITHLVLICASGLALTSA